MEISVNIAPSLDKLAEVFKGVDLTKAMQKAVEKYAYQIEGESKKVTPVDTGRLRASISRDIGNLQVRIAPHTNYAFWVHEGTRRMGARPFMAWGVKSVQGDPFEAEIRAELDKIKDKVKDTGWSSLTGAEQKSAKMWR